MIDKIKAFSIEEKLLLQAILSDYQENIMSNGMVMMSWNLRAFAPDDSGVKSLKDFISFIGDLQVELGTQLAIAGVPEELRLNAPISKTVFQSMTVDKKNIVQELLVLLGKKLGDFEFWGNQVYMNIWNNKLIR